MASATIGSYLSLWDVATGKQKEVLKKVWPKAAVKGESALALTSDFTLLAVGLGGKTTKVCFWEMPPVK